MSKATRIRRLKRYLATSRAKSELEVMAIHRQLEDLSDGHRRGLVWNEAEARRGVSFFSMLRHWKGRWSGEPVKLEPFQEEMIVAPIFGWYREDGARRMPPPLRRRERRHSSTPRRRAADLPAL